MAQLFAGATIAPKEVPIAALFLIQKLVDDQIKDRGWLYLIAIGYKPYSTKASMSISLNERSPVTLVHIVANFEQDHEEVHLNFDVPIKQFEALSPHLSPSEPK